MNNALRLVAASGLAGFCLVTGVLAEGFLDPRTPSVTGAYLAGQQAMSELRTPDASRYFSEATTDEWDNPLVLNRAFVAFAANGEIDKAADAARHMLELEPGSQLARLVIATEAMKQRRYAAAIRDLDQLGADSFEGITGAILKAWALTGDNRVDEAFASLDKIADGGLEEFLVFHRAMMADVGGRTDAAIDLITQAHDADPYTADIVESYARILGNAGRYDEALAAITEFEAQGLTHPIISDVKQKLLNKQRPGLFADSVQAGAAEMFHSVGVAFAREGTTDISLVLERLAQYLDAKNDTIPLVIGQLYDGAGQHELANSLYDAMPATSLLKPMAVVRVADNLDAMGDRPQAIRRLTNIVTTNPTDIDAISVLGDLLRSDKQYQASADAYSKALAVTGGNTPGDWRFYYVRGIAYERSDQFPLAEADFLKALDLNPNQPQVLNYLGYSWVDKGMNLDRALEMIEKAVEGSPNDGYIIDSLGWAFYRLGRFDEAVEKLEQAAILRSTDPEINDHLGDAYWRVGRTLEARFQWNIASAMDKEGNVKARIAPKLAGGLDAAPVTEDSAPVEEVPGRPGSGQLTLPDPVVESAPAKINLALHVTGRRADGYHSLEMLVAFAEVGDELEAVPAKKDSLSISGPFAEALGNSESNLVLRALAAFRARWPDTLPEGLAIRLSKNLPIAAGLGGGSADAAAALRLFASIADRDIAFTDLLDLGRSLGADVPMCLYSRPAEVRGIGEIVLPLKHFPACHVVLVNPLQPVVTADVFRKLERRDNPGLPDHSDPLTRPAQLGLWLSETRNDLEPPAIAMVPAIGELIAHLRKASGCILSRMSGSGATVFGLFGSSAQAHQAAHDLRAAWPGYWVAAAPLVGV